MENFKVIEKKENPLFNRKEVFFEVQADITPSRLETSKFFSKKFSTPIENIKIKSINGKFGSNIFSGSVFIYNSEEDKNRVEIKKKKDEKMKEALKPKEPEKEPKKEEEKVEKKVAESKEELKKEEKEEIKKEVKEELGDKNA